MATIAEKFKNKLTKKVFSCPSCSKQLRVPIKPGKTLMVSCPRCHGQIQLSFQSPVLQVFKWEKGRTLAYNFRLIAWRIKTLPTSVKLGLIIQTAIIIILIQFLLSWLAGPKPTEVLPLPAEQEYVRKI